MRKIIIATSAAFIAMSGAALAQSTVIIQEPAPAPVVTEQRTVVMPGEVRTYVMEQQPVDSVPYEGDVLVGRVLPETVQVRPVQGYDSYGYTVVNQRRVIVDPQTRQVIQVLD
jgi:hypothetical protein